MFKKVKLITFDLDDTLWPCIPVIQCAENELYGWLKENTPAITDHYDLEMLRAHREKIAMENPELAFNFTKIRLLSLQSLMNEFNLDLGLAKIANLTFRHARNLVTPYEEVIDTLKSLKGKYIIISITNGNAEVEKTPLSDCFDFNLMAEDVGAAKPNPALFLEASRISNIDLKNAVHVGDDPYLDIDAAKKVGMLTVWVNRNNKKWPREISKPDLQIKSLESLEKNMMATR